MEIPVILSGEVKLTIPLKSVIDSIPKNLQDTLINTTLNKEQNFTDLISVEGNIKEGEETTIKPISELPESKAEAFLNYTLILSDKEENGWIVSGELLIKNTGIQDLFNPYVCFKVKPPERITLGGQIVPPNVVDTIGVQNSDTINWKYVDEDWYKKGKSEGIYWIAPTTPFSIGANETGVHRFQISINPEAEKNISIEAFVYFEEQKLQVQASNQISLFL